MLASRDRMRGLQAANRTNKGQHLLPGKQGQSNESGQ